MKYWKHKNCYWVIDKHHVYLKSVSHKSKRLPNDWKLNIVRTDDGMKTNLVQTVIWWVQKMYLPKVFLLKQSTNQYWQNYQFCKLTEFSWRKISINHFLHIHWAILNTIWYKNPLKSMSVDLITWPKMFVIVGNHISNVYYGIVKC
jgi:hypothetical protein